MTAPATVAPATVAPESSDYRASDDEYYYMVRRWALAQLEREKRGALVKTVRGSK